MLKRIVSITAILCLLVLAVGCWDSKDINKMNIITTILLDRVDDEFVFNIEIANTDSSGKSSEGGGTKSDDYVVVKASGKTIIEARSALEKRLDAPLFFGATRALILTENLTNHDVVEYFNRIRADTHYRKKVLTVSTCDEPEKLFDLSKDSGESTGFYIEEMLKNMLDSGNTFFRPTSRFIENASSQYSGFLIPMVRASENTIELCGYSVISGSRSIGSIPIEESKGLVFLVGDRAEWEYQVPFEEVEYAVVVKASDKKIKPHYEEGSISFDIDMKFDAKIQYMNVRFPVNVDDRVVEGLKEQVKGVIYNDIESTIYKSQQVFNCDYLSFEDEFHIVYPSEYHELDWYEEYKNVKVNTNIKVDLGIESLLDYDNYKSE